MTTVLQARSRGFVSTPFIERLSRRAFRYLQSGFSVHLRGPAGTGKTTLALHLADLLGRPIMLIFGDDESTTSDLIGNQNGYSRKKVVDNFIHSVIKVEDEMRHNWVDSRLTMACREGFTLVYDEFNRSRPEVNNVLLSALEEKLLVLPPSAQHTEYLRVDSHFRGIFTSNPEEYCGVHSTQDALMDRLITIDVPEPDELTQQEIIIQKTGLPRGSAQTIVQLVKLFRQASHVGKSSGLRAGLMLAKVCEQHQIPISARSDDFRDTCTDVLLSRSKLPYEEATATLWECLNRLGSLEGADGVQVILAPKAEDLKTGSNPSAGNPGTNGHTNGHSNGHAGTNGHANGQANGYSNGHTNGHAGTNGHANGHTNGHASTHGHTNGHDPASAKAKGNGTSEPSETAKTPKASQGSGAIVPVHPQGSSLTVTEENFGFGSEDEAAIYAHLQASQGQHLSAIEAALGISRVQAVDALRSLAEKGLVVVQRDDSASHDAGRTIYRVDLASP